MNVLGKILILISFSLFSCQNYENNKNEIGSELTNVFNPANLKKVVGKVSFANEKIITESIINASSFYSTWKNTTVEERVLIIKNNATLYASGNII